MPTLHLRLTGGDDDARTLINLLTSLDGIEHVEEVDDLMPHMDDEDSSSAGLTDDIGPGFHAIEVEAPNDTTARRAREAAEALARDLGVALEIVDEP
ncbi:hypothetical protein [Dokdonella koreensis]|uniref:Uncharacterized protein n=1 Tax=Dokdonella koreensis DS-123 TaxID=1300342 RepID=A0A167GE05_9GAMM|nr:hypothetical protein [Dokdonella koreensis]ANB16457.1 Hypothetical protein I596_420 [Dokdonella koreensis DS-123]